MADLSVKIAGVTLKNPIIAASGTFGVGREYSEFYPLSMLGGVSTKGTTLHARMGNDSPRIAETPAGILNSVGLQNPGVDAFLNYDLPWLRQQGTVVIANIAGSSIEEYVAVAERVGGADVDIVELNISCPNVKQGGMAFGTSCRSAEEVTAAVRKTLKKPLMVKLSPNVTDIGEIAAAVEAAGADAVSLINTIAGMKIDINKRRPFFKNVVAGLSGPAVHPIAVRMVWQTANRVGIPVVGMGGVSVWQDAVELLLAGACAVQVGTANFTDPYAPIGILTGLENYLDQNNIPSVGALTGMLQTD